MVENYVEFEMELLNSSTRQMINRNQDYSWFQEEINKLNRRVVNLLSACRLYLDHSIHHLSNIFGEKSEQIESMKKYKSEEYDSKLGYRVMESMRNYVQHRGFPIKKCIFNQKRVDKKDNFQLLFTLTPIIIVDDLREDKKFKRSTVAELNEIGEEIDIKPLIREYIAGIATLHEKIRLIIKEAKTYWEKIIFNCIDKFQTEASPGEQILGLSAVITKENGTYNGMIPIFTDFIEHRRELEKKNRMLEKVNIRYVTNEII